MKHQLCKLFVKTIHDVLRHLFDLNFKFDTIECTAGFLNEYIRDAKFDLTRPCNDIHMNHFQEVEKLALKSP